MANLTLKTTFELTDLNLKDLKGAKSCTEKTHFSRIKKKIKEICFIYKENTLTRYCYMAATTQGMPYCLSPFVGTHSVASSCQHQNNFQTARKGYTLKVPKKFFSRC